ncbi:MAG: stage II sporulation protein M [Nanoarchaeota archaeon]
MVLEDIITPQKAEKHPVEVLIIGFIYTSIAILLSVWIFKQYSSLVMVFLTVIAAFPLLYNTFKYEEKADIDYHIEKDRLACHMRAIKFLVFLFLGMLLSFTFWFIVMPPNLVSLMFNSQVETINAINARIVGNFISPSDILTKIVFNNLKVLLFTIFFAFFYGAGTLFILAWNASVISAAIGAFVRDNIAGYASSAGLNYAWFYFNVFSAGLLRYLVHGIPEIMSYFVGGLAGGILSVAVINHDMDSKSFKAILLDSFILFLAALFILVIAALIEVYVMPVLF